MDSSLHTLLLDGSSALLAPLHASTLFFDLAIWCGIRLCHCTSCIQEAHNRSCTGDSLCDQCISPIYSHYLCRTMDQERMHCTQMAFNLGFRLCTVRVNINVNAFDGGSLILYT
ncbi:hypothetical protein K492DRAFT_10731 [Lichtheimia hyalospora FSU 10163]|nr:hypothetical protein K492DRAFT_10731 [Lichtheimia hyalospora FSU 10163]